MRDRARARRRAQGAGWGSCGARPLLRRGFPALLGFRAAAQLTSLTAFATFKQGAASQFTKRASTRAATSPPFLGGAQGGKTNTRNRQVVGFGCWLLRLFLHSPLEAPSIAGGRGAREARFVI